MTSEPTILLVQAQFQFSGTHNDELRFKKGDIITVTQKEEGGWWEGTFDEKTGWFPSNYVREYRPPDGSKSPVSLGGESEPSSTAVTPDPLSPQGTQQQKLYRNMVLKDILESEKTHVNELLNLLDKYLIILQKCDILSENEFRQLIGNLEDLISVQSKLFDALEEQNQRPSNEQRIGGVVLTMAPLLQNAHKNYCKNHPRAVCILEKYKDELNNFMEGQGAQKPGIMVLTTGLSKPFRRLDKYSVMLQEYHRHMEEGHPDKGDTQRSVHIVRELSTTCGSIRRQKELELEVLSGRVHGWDGGETLSVLGELVHMGSVALLPDHRDHYLILFPSVLVVLGVSPRMSAFIFQGKYPLNAVQATLLEDGDNYKNAFQISGAKIDAIIAVCQSRDDQQHWVDILHQQALQCRTNFNFSTSHNIPPLPPHGGPLLQKNNSFIGNGRNLSSKLWSLSCLRPSPPMKLGPLTASKDDKKYRPKKKDEKWNEEDALILRVIEAYCSDAITRQTVNSSVIESPPILIAKDEKLIFEEKRGSQVFIEEKSLVDTVYALKDKLTSLETKYSDLRKDFNSEKQSNNYLKSLLKQHVFPGLTGVKWDYTS